MEDLKKKAKDIGLFNMFLPKNHFKEGAGFSNLEYGLMAECLGKSGTASEVRMIMHNSIGLWSMDSRFVQLGLWANARYV